MPAQGYKVAATAIIFLSAPLVFLVTWGGWIYWHGLLIGVGLGWFPALATALIVANILGWLWPLWAACIVSALGFALWIAIH